MPTYIYEVIRADGEPGERFEIEQSIKDEALSSHPETGDPVHRVITAPYIPGPMSDHVAHQTVSDNKRLGELGLTKYVKAGDGHYEKAAGTGPDTISAD